MAKKKSVKLKEPVRIRFKELADGSKSIYLDIYANGKRSYKFLKLYILPEINPQIKAQNAITLEAAEKLKSQYVIELTEKKAGLKHTSSRSKMLLVDWLESYIQKRKDRKLGGLQLYETTLRLFRQHCPKVKLSDVDKDFCIGFVDFLKKYKTKGGKSIATSTQSNLLSYARTVFNTAVREEVLAENPFNKLGDDYKIPMPESMRQFLTVDEIKKLIATPCSREIIKRAYLFGCYSGLRSSDVRALRWGDMTKDGDKWRVAIRMKKTRTVHYEALPKQALAWLPERGEAKDSDRPFADLPSEKQVCHHLKEWAKAAGIGKHVTFHTSRHTFATLLISLDVDLYTTSKLMGHKSVKTTQIYAKIIDKKKEEAIDKIDDAFGDS